MPSSNKTVILQRKYGHQRMEGKTLEDVGRSQPSISQGDSPGIELSFMALVA